MISDKLFGYLGFAAKARKLSAGYNTCLMLVEKRKVRLLIIAEDTAEGSIEKMTRKCEAGQVDYRIFGRGTFQDHRTAGEQHLRCHRCRLCPSDP